ncbi:hypothetical protein PCE1_000501 [Barthelona sp. PCE]
MNRQETIERLKRCAKEHMENSAKVKDLQQKLAEAQEDLDVTEETISCLHMVGHNIGEILRPLGENEYAITTKAGSRYLVHARSTIPKDKLVTGARCALDMATMTIMRVLPNEVDPTVHAMSAENPGDIKFSDIGGLGPQLQELREVVEIPLTSPEIIEKVGIHAPKGCLLYGPPGTGKTLMARAIAANTKATFLKIVASSIVQKYIGESARIVRDMFQYAKDNSPCIIFIDEVDAIGAKRSDRTDGPDRDVQRTLMELLSQLDGFEQLSQVKVICATNRPDILDPALLRPGRLDRKVEIPLPNEIGREQILEIHSKKLNIAEEIDRETLVKMTDGFNGADIRNLCTEAAMHAIRSERDHVLNVDFMKAVRTVEEMKKLETKLDYSKV